MSDYPPVGSYKVTGKRSAQIAITYITAYVGTQFGDDADRVSALARSLADYLNGVEG